MSDTPENAGAVPAETEADLTGVAARVAPKPRSRRSAGAS